MLGKRSYDYTKEHKELDHNEKQGVFCPHCGKTVEDRKTLPDYGMFMGAVWIKQNLPCKPYDPPLNPKDGGNNNAKDS